MPLGSGAHVALGQFTDGAAAQQDLELMLAEEVEPHYNHRFEQILTGRQDIPGEAGKYQTNPGRLYWSMTDWTGGEGRETWDPNDPTTYSYSGVEGVNTRRMGQFTGAPKRSSSTIAEETTSRRPAYFASGGGIVWFGSEETVAYSLDYGVSWSRIDNTGVDGTAGSGILAGQRITAMAGDQRYLYFAASNTAGTSCEINRFEATGIATTTDATEIHTSGIDKAVVGMAIVGGYLYAWTGRKLFKLDINLAKNASTLPLNTVDSEYQMVHDAASTLDFTLLGRGNQYGQGVWYGDCQPTEQSVVYFVASEGITDVFEYKVIGGRGAPIWRLPYGFTGRCMTVQNNICFIGGQFGASNVSAENEFGGVYAMDLATRKVFFINHVRKNQNTEMLIQDMCMSWGSQIMFSEPTGTVFVYDMDTDGISQLANVDSTQGTALAATWTDGDSKVSALHTIGNRRLVAYYNDNAAGTTNWGIVAYKDDEPINRESVIVSGDNTWIVHSGEWDFGYPFETKGLLGLWITYKVEDTTASGLINGQKISVTYSLDGGTAETTVGNIIFSTVPSGNKGRAYLQVAAAGIVPTVPFGRVQFHISTISTTNGVKPPIVTGVAAEASITGSVETWDLVVRVQEEPPGHIGRPSKAKRDGGKIRDYLEDLVQNKATVTFKDGYRYSNNQFTTHTVQIEEAEDAITNAGEGAMRLKLKAVGQT